MWNKRKLPTGYFYSGTLAEGKELCDWDSMMHLLNDLDHPNLPVNRYGLRDTDRNGRRPWGIIFKEDSQHFGIWPGKSLNPYLFRGENKLYPDFLPSMQRGGFVDSPYNRCAEVIKKYEFIRIFKESPYYRVATRMHAFGLGVKLDFEAIAQHYSFSTNYIDVTRRKSIAYFFAYTYFKDGKYYPITDFSKYTPIIYCADIRDIYRTDPNILKKITFQVLKRPTLQYALGLEWDKNTKLKHFFKPKSLPRNPYYALQVYKAFRQGEALWPNPSSDPIYWLSEKIKRQDFVYPEDVETYCQEYHVPRNIIKSGLRITDPSHFMGKSEWAKFCKKCENDINNRAIKLFEKLSYRQVSKHISLFD